MGWLKYFQSFFCDADQRKKIISDLQKQVTALRTELESKIEDNDVLSEKIEDKERDVDNLENLLKGANEGVSEEARLSGKRSISHSWKDPKGKSVQLDVQDFVQSSVVLHELAKKKRLYLNDKTDYDKQVAKAYRAVIGLLDYRFDHSLFSQNERWITVTEAISLGSSDCEEKSMTIVSLLEHIGVPRDSVFVCIGQSFNGIGHATVKVKDSTGVFRHLNSSNLFENFTDLKEYPEFHKKDTSFRTNGFNLEIMDYEFNSIVAETKFENLDNYLIRISSVKPDSTQLNEKTEMRNRVVYVNGGVELPVRNCNVIIETDHDQLFFNASAGGVVQVNIPPRLVGVSTKVTFEKTGFKPRTFDVTFEDSKTTSFKVRLYRGQDGS